MQLHHLLIEYMKKIQEIEKVIFNLNHILSVVSIKLIKFINSSNNLVDGIPLDGIALKSCVDVKSVEELIENEKLKIQELLSRRN